MDETINDFGNWLSLKWSPMTVKGYLWELQALARALPGRGPLEFRSRDLNQYLAERRMMGGVGDSSIKRSVAAFKKFFGWVCKPSRDPSLGLEWPPVTHVREPRTLTGAQLEAVLASCDTSSAIGRRNYALIAVMVDARLRASEACRLRVEDVDFDNRRLSVLVKGRKRHVRKFSPETRSVLGMWLPLRAEVVGSVDRDGYSDPGTVFVSLAWHCLGEPLTSDGLRAVFRRIGVQAGLAAFSPHDLCRTFATQATLNGAPTRTVQVGGGWASMDLVQLYTRAVDVDQIDEYLPMRGRLG
jgi:integrase